eukprot:1188180-Prorocentrum_minimum.AAC.3
MKTSNSSSPPARMDFCWRAAANTWRGARVVDMCWMNNPLKTFTPPVQLLVNNVKLLMTPPFTARSNLVTAHEFEAGVDRTRPRVKGDFGFVSNRSTL